MRRIEVDKPEDVRRHIGNMGAIIAEAHLKKHGIYQCLLTGEKTDFILKA